MPKVSVIIPTYNRPTRLKQAIDSAINQTLSDLEIIVVDDNSPDSIYRKQTEELMNNYKQNDKVIYLKHQQNMNGAAARNTGIIHSKSPYIAFLDDDDLFYPHKLERQLAYMENHLECNGCFTARRHNGKDVFYKGKTADIGKKLLLNDFTPTTPSLMFKKETLETIHMFDVSFQRHQDYELLLKFLKNNRLGYIDEVLVEIGANDGENTLNGSNLERLKAKYLETFKEDIYYFGDKGFVKKVYIHHYVPVLVRYLKERNFIAAFRIYKKCLKCGFFRTNHRIIFTFIIYVKTHINKRMG